MFGYPYGFRPPAVWSPAAQARLRWHFESWQLASAETLQNATSPPTATQVFQLGSRRVVLSATIDAPPDATGIQWPQSPLPFGTTASRLRRLALAAIYQSVRILCRLGQRISGTPAPGPATIAEADGGFSLAELLLSPESGATDFLTASTPHAIHPCAEVRSDLMLIFDSCKKDFSDLQQLATTANPFGTTFPSSAVEASGLLPQGRRQRHSRRLERLVGLPQHLTA